MEIQIKRRIFDSMPTETVGHACFEPMVPVYQSGVRGKSAKDAAEFRTEFYNSLTTGQRALMFFTYYDHAIRSEDEFKRISQHYVHGQIFGMVKKGAEYFHDDEMIRLLSDIEQVLSGNGQSEMSEKYLRLKEISSNTLAIIGTYVKEHPEEFVCFE